MAEANRSTASLETAVQSHSRAQASLAEEKARARKLMEDIAGRDLRILHSDRRSIRCKKHGLAKNPRVRSWRPSSLIKRIFTMDKDRVAGSAKQIKGSIKEAVGKATGDAKLKASGKADKTAGKIQNAVGGVKDALRGK